MGVEMRVHPNLELTEKFIAKDCHKYVQAKVGDHWFDVSHCVFGRDNGVWLKGGDRIVPYEEVALWNKIKQDW